MMGMYVMAPELANERIPLAHIEADLTIVLSAQLQSSEAVLISGETSVDRLVKVDDAALNGEEDQRRLRGVVRDDQQAPGRPFTTTLNPPYVRLKWQGWIQTPFAYGIQ